MRRIRSVVVSAGVIALFAGVFAVPVVSADDKPKPDGVPAMGGDQAAMMEAYMKMAQPGPEHQRLAAMEGEWDATSKAWMPDGSPCGTGTGLMKCKMVLGGRYLEMSYDGEMDAPTGKMSFRGVALIGYDNAKKKYVNVWMDDMSTGPMITEGTADGDVVTSTGEYVDPITGKLAPVKDVATFVDKTHHKYELHMTGPDGQLYKCLEVLYTKK